ncbi:YceH family protein [Acidicapsa ligni]|uniref:YceH family protein n=1 Tax=Acidicapsa ligni TaxID=542300 RepID=UPI0021E087B4|nr:YceH family protein [Acidicapsa ligni]
MHLTPTEARVLGALVEKEITTPEYYPLSLNALVNACNQKNNREPVTSLDDVEVRQALHGLEDDRLAAPVRGDGRVPKFEHHMQEVFNFTRGEIAVICVLLLRGPQTPGELRGRTERMHRFDELSDVQSVLQRLISREPALVKVLPRQPGTKEARYAHLLSGDVESFEPPSSSATSYASASSQASSYQEPDPELSERMAQLEAEVAILTRELNEVREQVERLTKLIE